MACFTEECFEHGWFKYNLKLQKEAGYISNPKRFVFARALFYATSLIFSMKQSTIIEWTTHEKIITFAILTISYYIYSFCFSEFCAIMVLNDQHKLNYKDYIKSVKSFMITSKVDKKLQKRVEALLVFRWEYNENIAIFGE